MLLLAGLSACSDLTAADRVVTQEEQSKLAGQASAPIGTAAEHAPYDAGRASKIFAPSSSAGGTVRLAHAGDWGPLDPGGIATPSARNLLRAYGRTLIVFSATPADAGIGLVPDLAEALGVPSKDFKTWTYRLRTGLRYEDGTHITATDIRYGIERSLDTMRFPSSPSSFRDVLDLAAGKDETGLRAIETPDDRTIVFKLARPFTGFDFVAQLPATVPVPRGRDTGREDLGAVVASGPYKIAPGSTPLRFTLVRNLEYDRRTDPRSGRTALPDSISVDAGLSRAEVDRGLLSGRFDVEASTSGVAPATAARIAKDAVLKGRVDSTLYPRTAYTVINPDVAPFGDLDCRQAVMLAASRNEYVNAYGGQDQAQIAPFLLPPTFAGGYRDDARHADIFHALTKPWGDETDLSALTACGRPGGFATTLEYQRGNRQQQLAADGLKRSLAEAGIKVTIRAVARTAMAPEAQTSAETQPTSDAGLVLDDLSGDPMDGYGLLKQMMNTMSGDQRVRVGGPQIAHLMDRALREAPTRQAREDAIADVGVQLVYEAYVLPGVWLRKLLYRSRDVTNAFVSDAYGGYDLVALGTTRR